MVHNVRVLETIEERKSPLDVVLGSGRADTKKEQVVLRYQVKDGETYGKLLVDKTKHINTEAGTAYRCLCDCGEESYITPAQVHHHQRAGVGCLRTHCSESPLELKMKHNPTLALGLQLKALLKQDPRQVDNDWGGKAYGEATMSFEEGQANLIEHVWPMVDKELGEWWMYRINDALPYAAFNVLMRDEPGFNVLGSTPRAFIRCGDFDYNVADIASMFDLPVALVKQLRQTIFSDEDLMSVIRNRGTI